MAERGKERLEEMYAAAASGPSWSNTTSPPSMIFRTVSSGIGTKSRPRASFGEIFTGAAMPLIRALWDSARVAAFAAKAVPRPPPLIIGSIAR
jgi:hypothetical protein